MPSPAEILFGIVWVYILYRIGKWDDKRSARKFLEKHGLEWPGDE